MFNDPKFVSRKTDLAGTAAALIAAALLGVTDANAVVYTDNAGALKTEAAFGYNELTNTLTVDNVSVAGNTTLGDASVDTLTINAGTWTYGNNWSALRAAGTLAAGSQNILTSTVSLTGHAGGTSVSRTNREVIAPQGTNTIAEINGRFLSFEGTNATPITLAEGYDFYYAMVGGAVAGTVTGYTVRAPFLSGGSTVTTFNGFRIVNPASASITTLRGLVIENLTNATTVRGIQSSVASGTGKHNLYIDGTAANYFAGFISIGTTTAAYPINLVTATASADRGIAVSMVSTLTSAAEYGITSTLTAQQTSGSGAKHAILAVLSHSTGFAGTGNSTGVYSSIGFGSAVTATGNIRGHGALLSINAAATVSTWVSFDAETVGNAGSGTLGSNHGFLVRAQTVGTNIYGFRGQIASASSRYNLYMDGTADNYLVGNTGIGAAPAATQKLGVGFSATSTSSGEYALFSSITANNASGSNGKYAGFFSAASGSLYAGTSSLYGVLAAITHNYTGTVPSVSTFTTSIINATSGTITSVYGFYHNPVSNSGTIVTNTGIMLPAQTAGTTRYNLRSQNAAASGVWNLYIDGTAQNAFAGNVRIGSTTAPTVALDVTGAVKISSNLTVSSNIDSATSQNLYRIAPNGGAGGGTYIRSYDAAISDYEPLRVFAKYHYFYRRDGAGSSAVTLTLEESGSVIVGTQTSAIATTATDGFLYVPSCAGTPTGVPTAITGAIPIVVDSTNHKLYFYSGGAWRDAGP